LPHFPVRTKSCRSCHDSSIIIPTSASPTMKSLVGRFFDTAARLLPGIISFLWYIVSFNTPPQISLGSPLQARLHSVSGSCVAKTEMYGAHQHSLCKKQTISHPPYEVETESDVGSGISTHLSYSSPAYLKLPILQNSRQVETLMLSSPSVDPPSSARLPPVPLILVVSLQQP
jgi:hypothetical protein